MKEKKSWLTSCFCSDDDYDDHNETECDDAKEERK